MKQLLFLAFVLVLGTTAVGQQVNNAKSITPSEYRTLSRNQKAGAWILTGLGTAFLVGAASYDLNNILNSSAKSPTGFYLASLASYSGGVVLFFASGRNKQKANAAEMGAYIKMNSTPTLQKGAVTTRSYPSLAVTIPL